MDLAVVGKAVGLFAVTNVDDIVVLTLFFGQAPGRAGALRVTVGQCIGFVGMLAAAVVGAAGAGLLPESVVAYLGLVPLALGLRAGWQVWSHRGDREEEETPPSGAGVGVLSVATVTFANGGDNIDVYLPVFATTSSANVVIYCAVFLVMVRALVRCGSVPRHPPSGRTSAVAGGTHRDPHRAGWHRTLILIEGGASGL